MFDLLRLWSGLLIRLVCSRLTLLIENLALRQQLAAFNRQNSRPRLATADKIFGVLLLRSWSLWKTTLIVVSPETVVRWHRAGFQLYCRLIARVPSTPGITHTGKSGIAQASCCRYLHPSLRGPQNEGRHHSQRCGSGKDHTT